MLQIQREGAAHEGVDKGRFSHALHNLFAVNQFHFDKFISVKRLFASINKAGGKEKMRPVGHNCRVGAELSHLNYRGRPVAGFFLQFPRRRFLWIFARFKNTAGKLKAFTARTVPPLPHHDKLFSLGRIQHRHDNGPV